MFSGARPAALKKAVEREISKAKSSWESPQRRENGGAKTLERLTGIGPAYQAWEASALPLSYSRIAPF
jgi:hypothetical protein